MYYPEEVVEEVLRGNNIVDVVGSYVHLQKKGANYFGLCPFHNEKSPSFSVSEPKQIFYCFGCGAGGNATTFLMKYENYSFQEALQALADRAGIKLPQVNYSEEAKKREAKRQSLLEINKAAAVYYYKLLRMPKGSAGMRYFQERQLTQKTLRDFGLGFADGSSSDLVKHLKEQGFSDELILEAGVAVFDEKRGMHDKFWNRVMFPIQDVNSRVIGFGGRVMGDAKPKYLNSPETQIFDKSRNLYGLHLAKKSRSSYFILCEGYMDVIAMHQAGFSMAVASLGTSFTDGQAALIKRYVKTVLLAYDSDGAGVRAALRNIGILKRAGLEGRVVDLSPSKDPDELVKTYGKDELQKRIDRAENSFFYELRQEQTKYKMDDPAQRTQFHHFIVGKICEFSDDIERDNYIKEVSGIYYISEDSLRRSVAAYGRSGYAEDVSRNIDRQRAGNGDHTPLSTTNPYAGTGSTGAWENRRDTKRVSREDAGKKNQRLLLTWIADEPEIYSQVADYISPDDFDEGLYRTAAQGYWKMLQSGNYLGPASVVGLFETAEEQEEAATLFHTRIDGISDHKEREKALSDIIYNVKRDSVTRLSRMQSMDAVALRTLIKAKKDLQALSKIHIHLKER